MPAVSEAQRSKLYAKFGPAWMHKHHFDNPGPLPKYVNAKAALAGKQRRAKRLQPHLSTLAKIR